MRTTRRWLAAVVCGALLSALFTTAAVAKPPPVTKIRFTLDTHRVTAGEQVTGSVHVWTRQAHSWVSLPAVQLSLRVDGAEVDALETGVDGTASVAYTATEVGDHVMKVYFAGDELHRRARRAQGFEVDPPRPKRRPPPRRGPRPTPPS
jgi:hypothetical protein